MTTDQTVLTEISNILVGISEIDIQEDLVQTEELGSTGDFSEWRPLFVEITQFASRSSQLAWNKLSSQSLQDINGHLRAVWETLSQIREFPDTGYGRDQRAQFGDQLQSQFDALKTLAVPHVGYLSWDSIDLEEYQRSLNRNIEEGRETIKRVAEEVQATKLSAEEALATIRAAAAEAGVSQEAEQFHKAAERYGSRSQQWLKGAVASGLMTVAFALVLVFAWDVGGKIDEASSIQIILAKAAALAVLSYATITCVRLYRSNAHLAAVNQHREDALRTFQAFVDGVSEPEVKDKVLLAAANAAFGQTPTGLIGERGDGGNTVEVVEGLLGSNIRRS